MQFKSHVDNLVILGDWNTAIFSPEWVGKFLIEEKNLKVRIPLSQATSHQVIGKHLMIYVVGKQLKIQSFNQSDNCLELIQETATKVADYLPHTPVSAFGVNFVFHQKEGRPKINEAETFNIDQYELVQSSIKKTFQSDSFLLNLTATSKEDLLEFDFNFHHPISSLVQFKSIIDDIGGITFYKNKALTLMSQLFDLEIDDK